MDSKELLKIKEEIDTLLMEEDYYNIYHILKDHNENFSANKKNGVFFDLTTLSEESLDKIKIIIDFRKNNIRK